MGVVPKPPDLREQLRTIQRQLRDLTAAPRLANAAITDPDTDTVIAYFGALGSGEYAVVLQRNDGTPALAVYGGAPGAQQFLAVFDRAGNIVASDDTASGQGLARPYVPVHFASLDMSTASGTQSGSYVPLEQATFYKQHPRVYVQALVIGDTATAGDFRLYDETNAVQLGATYSLAAGGFTYATFGPVAVAGAHMAPTTVTLQGRRTAGAGFIRARVTTAYGQQT